MTQENWTIGKLIQWTQEFLGGKDIPSPRLEAEILLAYVLGLKRIQLYTNYERPVGEEERAKFRELVKKRAARCPSAYLTGVREFMSMEFLVTPDVLVPRPETEFVVESVMESARGREEAELLIADVGTGSGCIAVSLAARLKNARFAATDLSPRALEAARKNAEKHGVAGRIAFLEGDMLKPLEGGEYAGRLDFLLSNPPYVSEDEWPALPPEVRDYEPKQALLAQGDPLRYYRAICGGAPALLAPGGRVVVEVGKGRAEPVKEIFLNGHNFDEVKLVKDYGGIERIVVATKK